MTDVPLHEKCEFRSSESLPNSTKCCLTDVAPKPTPKDADVAIRSSDQVLFHLQRKSLAAYSGGFPGVDLETNGEVVELTEPASVLEMLFAFTLPQRYPDLEDQDFDALLALAEAVEKYEVYAAMYPCITGLLRFVREHAIEVLAHGLKHDYPKLVDEAAQHLLFSPAIPVAEKLPTAYILAWMKYHESTRQYIFGFAEDIIDTMDVVFPGRCYPYENPRQICRACRFLLKAWLGILQQISTRAELVAALQGSLHYPHDIPHANCRDCLNANRCLYLEEIARRCLERLGSVPSFTSFLLSMGSGRKNEVQVS